MAKPDLEKLESIIDRLGDGDDIDADELRAIAADLEAGEQYECRTCAMLSTGEDILVIYDRTNEGFIQIDVPMDESQPVSVTRTY